MIDVAAAVRAGIASLEANKIRYAVVGSVAASVWGVLRSTRDIDVVVAVQPDQLLSWLSAIDPDEFYVPVEFARAAIRSGGSFNLLHLAGGSKIDIFVPDRHDQLAEATLNRRIRSDVFGESCWVASAEDVVLAKLRWRFETRSDRQWMDCTEIVASVELDREYLWSNAAAYGVTDDLKDLLSDST